MKYKKILYLVYLIFIFYIFSCSLDQDSVYNKYKPGTYKMIEVPVPLGGITFPIGIDDDDTATINNIYYIGETQVTFALWQAVAYWATFEKKGGYYDYIYWEPHGYQNDSHIDYPICGITYIQALIWCNAYTEWHNEKYGTNYTPVYIDESGNPIRSAREPKGPSDSMVQDLYIYLMHHPMMKNYFDNIETKGDGFRLPTPNEWELAARWRGSNSINSVKKEINGIDFDNYPYKFTIGNAVSGANNHVGNLQECNKYAVFYENSFGNLSLPKTKMPNALNIYDMSGNLREYVYNVEWKEVQVGLLPWNKAELQFAETKGGYFDDLYYQISIGYGIFINLALYNYYYGFRVARNK